MKMGKATVDANLFRIVHGFISKEEIRYYLNGVLVEPCGAGVVMVATDGHRMLVAYDENGTADSSLIVKLPPFAVRECKVPVMFNDKRVLLVDSAANSATIEHISAPKIKGDVPVSQTILTAHRVLIEGSFPDWRRVVPTKEIDPSSRAAFVGFNGKYLADWSKVGIELSRGGNVAAVSIQQVGESDPALVRWSGHDNIIGVQMPMRTDRFRLPAFMNQTAQAA